MNAAMLSSILISPLMRIARKAKFSSLLGDLSVSHFTILRPHYFSYVESVMCPCRSPDTSIVRMKMVYASSKDRFKRELDGIQLELQATDPSEMSFDIIKARAL